jgi:hypothetical protein
VVPGNTLASQYWNWILYHLTTEFNNVLTAAGISQNSAVDNQLAAAIPVLASREVYTPTTGYTPAICDVVELNYDGTIRKAKRTNSAVLASGSTVVCARVAPLTATTAVIVYAVGLNLSAVVATINPFDLSITFGTPQAVKTSTTTLSDFDISASDSTHVLIVYNLTGASYTQLSVVSLTIAGTAITVNAAVNGVAAAARCTAYPVPGSSNVVIAYLTANNTGYVAVISSANTNTPVINTPVVFTAATLYTGLNANSHLGLTVSLNADLIAISADDTAGAYIQINYFTLSGTAIGAVAFFDGLITSANIGGWFVEEGPKDTWFGFSNAILYGASIYVPYLFSFRRTAAGTLALPILAPKQLSLLPNSYEVILKPIDRANGVFLFSANVLGADGNYWQKTIVMKRKGGSASDQAEWDYGDELVTKGYTTQAQGGACALPGFGTIIMVQGGGTLSQAQVVTQRRRNTILGVAVDTLGTVQRAGAVSGLSGLTQGVQYGIDDNGNLTIVVGEAKIGQALSTTVLDLQVIPGV